MKQNRSASFDTRMSRRARLQKWSVIGIALAAIVPLVATMAVPALLG